MPSMWRRVLSSSRFVVIVAVLGTLVGALALMIYAALEIVVVVADATRAGVSAKGAKTLALGLIESTDLFLLSVVMLIIGLGLHALFVDDTLPLPRWLEIHDLDDLKAKLISVVVAVLGVLFLGEVVKWDGQRELLGIGAGIALVIAALTFFLMQKPAKKE